MRVELCSGGHAKHGFKSLDCRKVGDVEFVVDLNKESLPFKDNSVEEFYEQYSFYELDNPLAVIKDCWRCLKPNGILEFREMYFASHYAYLPMTKNFWSLASARLFTKGYRFEGLFEIVSVELEESVLPFWLIKLNPNFYEKYLSRVFSANYIRFKLKKVV